MRGFCLIRSLSIVVSILIVHFPFQATSVVLFSKHNQKYFCSLPRRLAVVEQEEEEEENDPSLRHGVGELLESLKKTCFTKVST